jgi:hypothetical protein
LLHTKEENEKQRAVILGRMTLQQFFVGVEFAVFAGVVEGDIAVGAFFFRVDFAAVEGFGVDVDAYGALIKFGEIQDLVHGF